MRSQNTDVTFCRAWPNIFKSRKKDRKKWNFGFWKCRPIKCSTLWHWPYLTGTFDMHIALTQVGMCTSNFDSEPCSFSWMFGAQKLKSSNLFKPRKSQFWGSLDPSKLYPLQPIWGFGQAVKKSFENSSDNNILHQKQCTAVSIVVGKQILYSPRMFLSLCNWIHKTYVTIDLVYMYKWLCLQNELAKLQRTNKYPQNLDQLIS